MSFKPTPLNFGNMDMFKSLESPCTITSGASSSPIFSEDDKKSSDSLPSFESEDSVTSVASSSVLSSSSTSDELTQVSDISSDLPTSSQAADCREATTTADCSEATTTADCSEATTTADCSEATTAELPLIPATSSPSTAEEEPHRPLRKKRKIFSFENCPICGVTVRLQHLRDHYNYELTKLNSLRKKSAKPRKEVTSPLYKKLVEVKANRVKRGRGSKNVRDTSVNTCIVCHPDSINDAMSACSRAVLHFRQCENMIFENAENVAEVIESDESFEEYSIGEEDRIRAVSLLESLATMPFDRIQNSEEDINVVIDSDDDAVAFGPSQFSEHDLRPCQSTLDDENRVALREAFLSSSSKRSPRSAPKRSIQPPDKENDALGGIFEVPDTYIVPTVDTAKIQERHSSSESIVIAALKSKIKELEAQVQNSAAKCNICLGDYKEPLVSVNCWHVSCKDCWMKTLGEKKLCPQCTKITLPTYLRRIYM